MNKLFFIVMVAICIPQMLNAQSEELSNNQVYGKIFLDEDTTLDGILELNGDMESPWMLQDRVRFFTKEQLASGRVKRRDKQKFSPEDILGYEFDGRIFLSQQYKPEGLITGRPWSVFVELMVDGPLQVFRYFDSPPAILGGTKEYVDQTLEDCRNNPEYHISKNGEPMRNVTAINIMDYISDSPDVVFRYKEGYYGEKPVENDSQSGLIKKLAQKTDSNMLAEQIVPLANDYNAIVTGKEQ